MESAKERIEALIDWHDQSPIRIHTLGRWEVHRDGTPVDNKEWGRDKTIQLIQYLVTARHRKALHKEQIIDRIWEDLDGQGGGRDFKVAMHGVNKVLEPNRPPRTEPKYVVRQGVSYLLNTEQVWIDAQAFESFIAIGNEYLGSDLSMAQLAYRHAISLHHGIYLPNRLYQDWTSEERERLQVLALAAYVTLAETLVQDNPMESIRLSQLALKIDASWEDAYRVQIKAFAAKGNRPGAIKAYRQCEKILDEEFGLNPLPETKQLLEEIKGR